MGFQITLEQVQRKVPVTIFHLSGSLNMSNVNMFEEQTRQAFQQGARYLLLDFKDVDAVRSAGLHSVQVVYKILNPKDALSDPAPRPDGQPFKTPYLKLVNLSPNVYYVFEVSGFLRNIDSYNDMEEALNSFE